VRVDEERQVHSDPDASWGHRSAVSTRKGGGFYGYRIHAAVCAATGLPLAWQVETARSQLPTRRIALTSATPAAARGQGRESFRQTLLVGHR
jgi:hypothetical protein